MEVFKKMGPRVILVEHRGRLMGLVTVKDCLKYQFKVEAQENAIAAGAASGLGIGESNDSNNDGARPQATLEEKLWDLIQRVVFALRFHRGGVRLDSQPSYPNARHEEAVGILEGTEAVETTMELEER